ncbi:MAG: helix-turn-helix domain-containing protein [Eubacteriales bacterium]|nr:helix-turn-helix domain-containing protein [Eubacteriales bacterium]
MTWLERMNRTLDYIEENLNGHIDYNRAAQLACYSVSHLQRVFALMADMPLGEYIRRRRLTMAAFELQNSAIKVIDVAMKYGYDSPEAFARAFHNLHGATPSSARDEGVRLKAYPRISFLLTIKGAVPMDYRIETSQAFDIYGLEGIFDTEGGQNLRDIPQFWLQVMQDGRFDRLLASTGQSVDPDGLCLLNAVCDYRELPGTRFPYMIFARRTPESKPEGYVQVTVPAATWAVFTSERHGQEQTSAVTQDLIKRVYTEWLPTAGYDILSGYELELYYGTGENCRVEARMRVEPKN